MPNVREDIGEILCGRKFRRSVFGHDSKRNIRASWNKHAEDCRLMKINPELMSDSAFQR